MPVLASEKATAQVKAAKGPVQITLRVQKTKLKANDSLWYKIELKNVGNNKLRVYDRIFKDRNAIHANSKMKYGLYLEVLDPKGKPLRVKMGHYRVRYDWEGPDGKDYPFTPEEKKELLAKKDGWKKKGMTEQEQSIAWTEWINELYSRKNSEEDLDPARQFWLSPGASTATFARADLGPDDYPGRGDDEESLRQGYAELWIFKFHDPGKYRIRAIYDQSPSDGYLKERKLGPDDERIQFKTPFIEFEVRP